MRRSIVYILIAAVFAGLGVAEDRYELLADIGPDFLWIPVLPWCVSVLMGCLAILATMRIYPGRDSFLPLGVAILALGFVLNKVMLEMPETLAISGGFEGRLPEATWQDLDETMRPVVMQTMFWDVYDYAYSTKAMGVKDIRVSHKSRAVMNADWTEWTISVTCKPRRIPRQYRRYAPVPLLVSYLGAKIQFCRQWPPDVAAFKHKQAVHNFVMELMLCGFPNKQIAKAVECISLYDDDREMKSLFAEQYEKMKAKE